MTALGITGHMRLSLTTMSLVRTAIDGLLGSVGEPIEGWTSLAVGADQIFAEAVLAVGGSLVFVNPCKGVESTIGPDCKEAFERLRSASREIPPPFPEPTPEAFWAAGKTIAETVDLLIAVWDSGPSGGLGGTADVVEYRQSLGLQWVRVWPHGASRG